MALPWRPRGVAFMILTMLCVPFVTPGQNLPDSPRNAILVDVDLVLVTVTVTDSRNRFVQGLPRERFRVWEDRVEQEILHFSNEDTPVSLGIIIDRSGSMGGRRPSAAIPGVINVPLTQALSNAYSCLQDSQRDDEYFLIEFSDSPAMVTDFTSDMSKLRERLVFMGAGGQTALWDAVYAGIAKLEKAAYSRRALLVLTDGLENHSRYTLGELKGLVRERDVRIYSMGGPQVQFDALASLVDATGGRIFRGRDPCRELAADLKSQYVIGYHPTNRDTDGAWRDIRVRLENGGLPGSLSNLTVRARAGYFAASEATGNR